MAEIALGIPGLVDVCIKWGFEIYEFCSAVKNALPELIERAHLIDLGWKRCVEQLKFLKAVSTKGVFDEDFLRLHKESINIFQAKISNAMIDIEKLFKLEWIRRPDGEYEKKLMPKAFKYAFKKSSLDKLVAALDFWHGICDPTWYLMLRNNSPGVKEAIREVPLLQKMSSVSVVRTNNLKDMAAAPGSGKTLKLDVADIQKMEVSEVRLSSARLAVARRSSGAISTYILDGRPIDKNISETAQRRNVVQLCKRLQHDEPDTFNLLQSKGYVEETDAEGQQTFTMVFRSPPNHSQPRSLRDLILNGPTPPTLSHRFALAKQLAKAVTYIHVFSFVHKSIHPGNVLCFDKAENETPSAFLVGFESFRDEDGHTSRRGDDAVEKNLYRHWTRQGASPSDYYTMQHDIYSLGVCMLEIGLWKSFVNIDPKDGAFRLSRMFPPHNPAEKDEKHHLGEIAKHGYLQLCRTELRSVMGSLYAEIVETCLTCLNRDNADFGDAKEFEDDDGIKVGYRYIEKVLHRLEELRV